MPCSMHLQGVRAVAPQQQLCFLSRGGLGEGLERVGEALVVGERRDRNFIFGMCVFCYPFKCYFSCHSWLW